MSTAPMSLADLQRWPKETVSPRQASGILNIKPYDLYLQAKAGKLEITHRFNGRNLRISKGALLKWCCAERKEDGN